MRERRLNGSDCRCGGLILSLLLFQLLAGQVPATGQEPATPAIVSATDYIPKAGEFPPMGAGTYFVGELVQIDHVNRRGALRLAGDGIEDRYHSAPSHQFAMLPYGTIYYHGAPAELRDIPLGTVLHGTFCLPPEGDQTIPPPDRGREKYVPKYSHALVLEDDISFQQRQNRIWRLDTINLEKRLVAATLLDLASGNSIGRQQSFEVDEATRVWKGRQLGQLSDLVVGQTVQLNLGWAPDWVNGQFHWSDAWLDEESRQVAADQQRAVHLRYTRVRGIPAWVDQVEHQPGGKGIVTVTLFGGRDRELTDLFKKGQHTRVAAAEWTTRSWWQDHDFKGGNILERTDLPEPPPGSSGIRLQLQCNELLEGFRPGRIVRLNYHSWPRVKLPPEERVKDMSERQ